MDSPSSRRPPAAKQERSIQLRNRVIEQGRLLVEQGGFPGTSMAELARAAGCSVGALYYHFPDKEALFDCVVEEATSSALEAIRTRAAEGRYRLATTAEVIRAVVEDFSGFIHDNQGMIRAVYQRAMEDARYWSVVRSTGFAMGLIWSAEIMHSTGRSNDMRLRHQIRVALVQATSVLTYSALVSGAAGNQLSRAEQIHWLTLIVTQIIEAPPFDGHSDAPAEDIPA